MKLRNPKIIIYCLLFSTFSLYSLKFTKTSPLKKSLKNLQSSLEELAKNLTTKKPRKLVWRLSTKEKKKRKLNLKKVFTEEKDYLKKQKLKFKKIPKQRKQSQVGNYQFRLPKNEPQFLPLDEFLQNNNSKTFSDYKLEPKTQIILNFSKDKKISLLNTQKMVNVAQMYVFEQGSCSRDYPLTCGMQSFKNALCGLNLIFSGKSSLILKLNLKNFLLNPIPLFETWLSLLQDIPKFRVRPSEPSISWIDMKYLQDLQEIYAKPEIFPNAAQLEEELKKLIIHKKYHNWQNPLSWDLINPSKEIWKQIFGQK